MVLQLYRQRRRCATHLSSLNDANILFGFHTGRIFSNRRLYSYIVVVRPILRIKYVFSSCKYSTSR